MQFPFMSLQSMNTSTLFMLYLLSQVHMAILRWFSTILIRVYGTQHPTMGHTMVSRVLYLQYL
jgi:hypothetical protein